METTPIRRKEEFNSLLESLDSLYKEKEQENISLVNRIEELEKQLITYKLELNTEKNKGKTYRNDLKTIKQDYDSLIKFLLTSNNTLVIHNYLKKITEEHKQTLLHDLINLVKVSLNLELYNVTALIIRHLAEQIVNIKFNNERFHLLEELFDDILNQADFDNVEFDENYSAMFEVINKMYLSPERDKIREFLKKNTFYYCEVIFKTNSPKVICEVIACYFKFNLKDELNVFFDQLIKEWSFLISQITENNYVVLLWISLYLDRHNELLNLEKPNFEETDKPELLLFNSYIELVNGRMKINQDIIKSINKYKSLFYLFPKEEKKLLLAKFDKEFKSLRQKIGQEQNKEIKKEKQTNQTKSTEQIKLSEISKLPKRYNSNLIGKLEQVEVLLGVYKDETSNHIHHFTQVNVNHPIYNKQRSDYFISKGEYKVLRRKEPGYWVDIVYLDDNCQFFKRQRVLLIEPSKHKSKKETAHNQIGKHDKLSEKVIQHQQVLTKDDNVVLNDRSALRQLGYQITGLSRVKRWEILTEQVVPKLGLKKAVYTIAFLIRGRKAMDNGLIRNKNSITEWGYDLDRLKRKYYKGDFSWPKT